MVPMVPMVPMVLPDAAPPQTVSQAARHGLVQQVAHALAGVAAPDARLCVGLSGGIDSVVLLDVLVALAPRQRWRISALHVNHQLSAYAGDWARFCRRLCRARGVPLRVVKVTVPRGDSTEAAARAARYAAYRAQPAEHVVLAQHQDDQAETVLLQLLRGAGVKGLAAMPLARADGERAGLRLLRPLLGVTRHDIEAYAAAHGLQWVDDESNRDSHYLRNFLRQEIFPRLAARVPAYRATLARAAAQLGEAAQLLDALAAIDGAGALANGTLAVAALRALPPDARRLDEELRQAVSAKSAARLCVNLGCHDLRCYRGALHVVAQAVPRDTKLMPPWRGERRIAVPQWLGVFEMQRRRGAGIDLAQLQAQPVTLRLRRGGEKLRPDAARPRRPLKDLFQALQVPPWRRDHLPLLWSGERLVWVPGVGIDCAFQARAGAPGVVPRWADSCTAAGTPLP
jgi:tRNA(Ile)-lysidine synthase